MSIRDHSIGIVGLGQIGGSIAAALKSFDSNIVITACDLSDELCRTARERGLADVIAVDTEDVADKSDIVVIALPVMLIAGVLRRYRDSLADKLLVTDTGSLKREIIHTAQQYGMQNFVGGHPLAGTELRGVQAWNAELFRSTSYFIATTASTTPKSLSLAQELIGIVGARS